MTDLNTLSKDEILQLYKQQQQLNKQQQDQLEQKDRALEQKDRALEQQQQLNKQQQDQLEQKDRTIEERDKNFALLTLDHTLRTLSTPQSDSSPTFRGNVVKPQEAYPTHDVGADAVPSDIDVSGPLHFLQQGKKVPDSNNSAESITQSWYTDFLKSVVECCCSGELEVVDTCQSPFHGLGMQPDLLVCQKKESRCLFPEMVLGVVELKAGKSRSEAECQIVQRVEELLHFVRQDHTSILTEPFTLHGIVADDVGARWVTVRIGCYNEESKSIPISRIFYRDVLKQQPNAFVELFVAFLRAIKKTNESRPSSKVDGVPITRFHLRKPSTFERNNGKASVYLEVNGEEDGKESIVKLFPDNKYGKEQFAAEKGNIQKLQRSSTARDLVNCFTFETSERAIRSSLVGVPLRFRSGKDAKKCFDSILGQLNMLWDADMFHGDVSPKNIILVESGSDHPYHLIDFGNTEEVTITIKEGDTVPNRGTMPFTVLGARSSTELDTFQLGTSVIFTYGFCTYRIGAWWGAKSVSFDDVFAARRQCLEEAAREWPQVLQPIAKDCIDFLDAYNNGNFEEDETTHAAARKRSSQSRAELPSKQIKKGSSNSPDATHRPEEESEEDSADAMIELL